MNGVHYTKNDIIHILKSDDPAETKELFIRARKMREQVCGDRIFAYGFVYFSTYCRNDCNFCFFRNSNDIERYRKSKNEALALSKALIDSGVNAIDLTTGEDPLYHNEDFKTFCEIISEIKHTYNVPVMASPGVVDHATINALRDAGADWYALYQETHNRDLFKKLRKGQSYDERMETKLYAKEQGMLIEEGILAGVGESAEDIADSLLTMGKIGARQVRIMSFVPQRGSPMENIQTPDREEELKVIALMRCLYPEALIPASLDVDGIDGLKERIQAGANLITSIIPPESGLMGVANSTMDVDNGGRTIHEAAQILNDMGLRIATKEEYIHYMNEVLRK